MQNTKGVDNPNHNTTFLDLFKGIGRKGSRDVSRDLIGDDRYRAGKILGRGGSALVYKAWDKELKKYVAVKVSRKRARNFIQETRLVGKLSHDNIATIYDAGSGPDVSYIIMEYVQGSTLKEFCNKENLMPPRTVCEIIIGVCKGLHYAHTEGIIHKDIKPSNIILNKHGVPKITDFGIAQMVDKTLQLGLRGTPAYMSPEQLTGEMVTNKSDIFSLGCVLYELLEGKRAFGRGNIYSIIYKITNEDPAPLTIQHPKLRDLFSKIILKVLAKKPDNRYGSCHDLAYDLSRALVFINQLKPAKNSPILSSVSNCIKGIKIFNPPRAN